ncbi:glycosyltransferase family 4 protein [Bacillus sp. V33-4]|uniref:glycosyltransferase family 4 protein n=1 Tax=Bacillus sp. V33-4 TaxID=2054169 RepID=UPI000C768DA5|nr:glycosyltransferase family 4 protein [Bacillus sp. V33-4]PLR85415.1 glycosyltransferase [Bacillus sp. V33-4]
MKVIFLRSNSVDPDSRVEKEVNSLIKAGYNVEIVAWDRDTKYNVIESYLHLEANRVKVHRFGIPATFGGGIRKNLRPLILFQIKLYYWLYKNRNNYDIIHACDFDTAYTAFKIAKRFDKKFVYDIFDYYVDAFGVPKYLKKLIISRDHKIINSADGVIICSEKRIEQIKGTSPKVLEVIHNTPANIIKNLEKLNLNKTKIKIVYVGVLGSGRFTKEIAEIVKDNLKYEFHIGGFGQYDQYFEEMSTKYSNIIYYGKLSYKETLQLENSCDIMMAIYDPSVPNHYYAAPNKFYEALMLGKPIVMVANTGMDEVISANNIGEVINYDPQSLKKAIEHIVQQKSEWNEISCRMKSLYERDYSWREMEKRLISFYKQLISIRDCK